jgi:hypothetical protein
MMTRNKNILLLLLLVMCCLISFSQNKSDKKKSRSLLKDAQYYFDGEDYFSSWQLYRKVLALDPGNERAGVNGAICIYKLNYPVDSAAALAPNLKASTISDAKYYLAKIRHQQRSFEEALILLDEYSKTPYKNRLHTDEEISYLTSMCINARAFISKPHRSMIKNMGQNINSPYPDYAPVIVPDESALYFTSKREGSSSNKKNGDNSFYEDVYVSYKEDGAWGKAENAGEPINTETNDGCVAISSDGQRMIVFRTSPDLVNGDLYTTWIGPNNKWEPLQLMNKEINSPYIETSACFSNDTSEIFFSSNRPGGFGGKDLYRIKKLPNGQWSVPLNLGPSVNTIYDDDAPFLHPDGITLYYSSKGHNTMGDYDIFKSVWDANINQFSQAENLGSPINDVGSDIFFVLSVDGQRGYYSSLKEETFGDIDIYQVDTRFGDNDLKVEEGFAFIEGQPGRVKIILTDKETSQVTGNFYSNPNTGRFILITNPLKFYNVQVEADDCNTINMEIKPMTQDVTSHYLEFKLKKSNAQ